MSEKNQDNHVDSNEIYKIKLPQFEGPFDLLLFFIERDELNIYDIPIAKITDEFLSYTHQLDELNIEVASEFILVAATLMRIKAKTLLPRKELDADGNEIDPREELVQRLIEYKQFKEVTIALKDLEADRLLRSKRGNTKFEVKKIADLYSTEAELENLELYQLMKAFKRVINRMEERDSRPVHTVVKYHFTIKDQKAFLLKSVTKKDKIAFEDAFAHLDNRVHAVFTFLAMLELIQEKFLKIKLGLGTNNFWISRG